MDHKRTLCELLAPGEYCAPSHLLGYLWPELVVIEQIAQIPEVERFDISTVGEECGTKTGCDN